MSSMKNSNEHWGLSNKLKPVFCCCKIWPTDTTRPDISHTLCMLLASATHLSRPTWSRTYGSREENGGEIEEAFLVMWSRRLSALNPPLHMTMIRWAGTNGTGFNVIHSFVGLTYNITIIFEYSKYRQNRCMEAPIWVTHSCQSTFKLWPEQFNGG